MFAWKSKLDKLVMISLIIACTGLAISAGLASATLMKPRLQDWPAGGTEFRMNVPADTFNSINVSTSQVNQACSRDSGNIHCPSSDWQSTLGMYMSHYASTAPSDYIPDTLPLSSAKAVREATICQRSRRFKFACDKSFASVSFSSVADAIVAMGRLWAWVAANQLSQTERFWSRNQATYQVKAPMPVVFTRCSGFSNMSGETFRQFQSGNFSFYDLWTEDKFAAQGEFDLIHFNYKTELRARSMLQGINSTRAPAMTWLNVPQSGGTNLGALLLLPQPKIGTTILACTVDARLRPSTMVSTRNPPTFVQADWKVGTYDHGNQDPRASDRSSLGRVSH